MPNYYDDPQGYQRRLRGQGLAALGASIAGAPLGQLGAAIGQGGAQAGQIYNQGMAQFEEERFQRQLVEEEKRRREAQAEMARQAAEAEDQRRRAILVQISDKRGSDSVVFQRARAAYSMGDDKALSGALAESLDTAYDQMLGANVDPANSLQRATYKKELESAQRLNFEKAKQKIIAEFQKGRITETQVQQRLTNLQKLQATEASRKRELEAGTLFTPKTSKAPSQRLFYRDGEPVNYDPVSGQVTELPPTQPYGAPPPATQNSRVSIVPGSSTDPLFPTAPGNGREQSGAVSPMQEIESILASTEGKGNSAALRAIVQRDIQNKVPEDEILRKLRELEGATF